MNSILLKYINCKNLSVDLKTNMPKIRQTKFNDYIFDKDKKLCLGAWLLLDDLKKKNFSYTKYGKPYIKGSNVKFNISHSGDYAICAFSDIDIGCDIEKIASFDEPLLEQCMQDDEIYEIKKNNKLFYDYWTMKESYIKCIGKGLNLDPKTFSVKSINDHYFYKIRIDNNYSCTVCSKYKNAQIELKQIIF